MMKQICAGLMGLALGMSTGAYASSLPRELERVSSPSSTMVSPSERLHQWVAQAQAQVGPYQVRGIKEGNLQVLVGYDTASPIPQVVLRAREMGGMEDAHTVVLYGSNLIPDSLSRQDHQFAEYMLRQAGVVPPEPGQKLKDVFPGNSNTLADYLGY